MSQHMEALAKANQTRLAWAELRREFAGHALPDGRERVAELLEADDPRIGVVPVLRLLTTPRSAQRPTALEVMRVAGVHDELRRVRDLTERQRTVIADLLREQARAQRAASYWQRGRAA